MNLNLQIDLYLTKNSGSKNVQLRSVSPFDAHYFSVKELFFDNFAVLYVENPNFFECNAWLAFERNFLFQNGAEKFTRDNRFAASITMYSFNRGPARDTFRFDGFQAIGKDGHSHRCRFFGLLANNVFMIEIVLDLDKFPLRS